MASNTLVTIPVTGGVLTLNVSSLMEVLFAGATFAPTVVVTPPVANTSNTTPVANTTPNTTPVVTSGSPFWIYNSGVFAWGGDYSYPGPNSKIDYANHDVKAADGSSNAVIKVFLAGQWGAWQPYANNWDQKVSSWNYLTFKLMPTVANQVWGTFCLKVGDVNLTPAPGSTATGPNDISKYGPATAVVGQWNTYKIPRSAFMTDYASGSAVVLTDIYKFDIQDKSGAANNTFYVDQVAWTN